MGNAFALLQVKAIIAVLLRHYEFELTGDPIEADFHGLVIGPKEPMRLRYRRRKRAFASASSGATSAATKAPVRRLQVSIDRDLCQAHAVCIEEAPEVFTIASDGRVELLQTEVTGDNCARAQLAEKYCPNRTITVREAG
jgi:sterol 14-demethylase